MTTSPGTLCDKPLWHAELQQWAQRFSPQVLGTRLALLLRQCPPADANRQALLDAIIQQYRQPDEQRRWHIFEQAKKAGFNTATGALALSLFWSAGSMAPEGLAPVYPQPHLSPQMLQCALLLCATQLAENPAEGVQQLIARATALEVA
ncbi:hypothetical protein BL250_14445 [Erwinia sp. OLTSP20]|uniref:DUF6931 family protein n=1 Tax=unclassified Erwinia TaxID=2622719 RepID=UPI000C1968C0|nr:MULTISPECIES: hypothetical protein [unclassified Erwinia]PIJ48246.1 hypothetical protein BV501_17835 [Erwinia sp. OAMSP11]PIJ68746.1 hypothetical protein BK416_16125 [Erwinia sp. OLSSP12]PIJ78921.1 hypothetical protein BLD47_16040 [Erwinia sp. OLCASP19]PIJ79531.1 hypothetical protein BLD46_16835 [Erwinia sp. OLMTSP26]PIJ81489.1 hypothetical protein BLD49_16445 [Erwinia sp. OLMDSP33]